MVGHIMFSDIVSHFSTHEENAEPVAGANRHPRLRADGGSSAFSLGDITLPMNATSNPYSDLWVLTPVAAMFVIVFCIVYRVLGDIEIVAHGPRPVLAFCVTALAIYGLDQTLIRHVVAEYTAMGVTMLITLASLLLGAWMKIVKRKK